MSDDRQIERILRIADHAKTPAAVKAVEAIVAAQAACRHRKYNPTIKGGWKDGRDCRVCSDCGRIDVLTSSDAEVPHA